MSRPPPPLSNDEALHLHNRLMEGDPVAPSDLALAYLDSLIQWLKGRFPTVEEHLRIEAAEDALLSLMKNPASYRPDRGSLDGYLHMSASGDLQNLLRNEERRRIHEADLDAVELSPQMGKYIGSIESDPATIVQLSETVEERMQHSRIPASVRDNLDPKEVQVLELMQIGERRTILYAQALDIAHLPSHEQRQEVKRVKDRLTKRLQRAGGTDD